MILSLTESAEQLRVSLRTVQREIRTGKHAVLSMSAKTLDILFDDGTDSPYSISVDVKQQDRLIPKSDRVKKLTLYAYGSAGLLHEWPAYWERA
jgi:hypothetical protein